jgi:hypothetical protein
MRSRCIQLAAAVLAAAFAVVPAAMSAGSAAASTNLLTQTNLIDGSEIGMWETNGGPALNNSTVTSDVTATKTPLIRYGVYDCFTDETCGTDSHTGSMSKSTFETTVSGITGTLHAVPWIKLVPGGNGTVNSIDQSKFCPPATGTTGTDWGMNLAMDEEVLQAISAVYTGPIVVEDDNEGEYSCYASWGFSSGGSVGVSTDLGHMWSATMPALKAYALGLGFSQFVSVGYMGVNGGPGWGQSCTSAAGYPYGYNCAVSTRWVDEFNNQVESDYAAASTNKSYYIPDVESVHSYCHGNDFATAPYTFDDNECYAFQREQITSFRSQADSIWGSTIGDNIRFSVSEWSPGECPSSGSCWSGWSGCPSSCGTAPGAYIDGYLSMLAGDGNTTGSGTAYWDANLFVWASNCGGGADQVYNIANCDGTTPAWYSNVKTDFLATQQAAPAVTTNAASGVTGSGATLNGSVNPEGASTTYQFDYGTTTSYGTSVPSPAGSAGSGTSAVSESYGLTGLAANTTYHYRIEATNPAGTAYGSDQTFTTSSGTCTVSEDASTPAVAHTTTYGQTTVTSASFSPPAGSLLEVMTDALHAGDTVTLTDSKSGTYIAGPHIQGTTQAGSAYFFQRYLSAAPGSMTVTAHISGGTVNSASLAVRVVDGAASSQTGAASATGTGNSTGQYGSLTTTKAGSWVYAVMGNGDAAETVTPLATTSSVDVWKDSGQSGNLAAMGRSASATGTPGAANYGWTGSSTDNFVWAAQEVLPATTC